MPLKNTLGFMPNKRLTCDQCQRPIISCLCDLCNPVANEVAVLVLQHPKETAHAKGSLPLLKQSLQKIEVWRGEVFDQLPSKLDLGGFDNILLYPSDETIQTSQVATASTRPRRLILLDATWRKSYKMLQLNPALQTLARFSPNIEQPPMYLARKAKKGHQYSSLEACCYALAELEGQAARYQGLLNNFQRFNQRLLQQRQR